MAIHLFQTIARLIIGLYFLAAGTSKFGPLPVEMITKMTATGIPNAEQLYMLAAACEVIGGVCLIIGLQVRLVAFLLAAFVAYVSWKLHDFWQMPQGETETMTQMVLFLKNMAIMGGLFALVAHGSGPASADHAYGIDE